MTAPVKRSLYHALFIAAVVAVLAALAPAFNSLPADKHSLLLDVGINIILAVSLNLILGMTGQFSLGHAGFLAAGAYAAAIVTGRFYGPQMLFWNQHLHVSIATAEHLVMITGMLSAMAVAAFLGWLVGLPTLRLRGDYLAIATLGFGEILAVVIRNINPAETDAGPAWYDLGGSTGLSVPGIQRDWAAAQLTPDGDPTPFGQSVLDYLNHSQYLVGFFWVFVAAFATVMVVRNIKYATSGRALLAIREDPIASESVGVPTTRYKVLAFMIGAALAGLAGGLLAYHKYLHPESFRFMRSIEIVAMVILGGQGSITGSILAAVALTLLPEELRSSQWLQQAAGRLGVDSSAWDDIVVKWRMVIYSLAIILSMLLRPQGIFGRYEIHDLFTRFKGKKAANDPPSPPAAALPTNNPQKSGAPLLAADNLGMSFGGLRAVDDLNLSIRPGDLAGLIGPNGAGKTTVFNLLTGVYRPTQGTIRVGPRAVQGLKPHVISAAGVARTFQNIRLFANLTVLDNVQIAQHAHHKQGFPAAILRTPAFFREEAESRSTALALLKIFNLDPLAHEQANALSYGDQRRLEIARALATKPTLLLLDEPAAGMNPTEKRQLMETIRRIRDQFHLAVLIIEHDMKLVMGICEHITVLDYGRTIAVGTPDSIRQNPAVIQAYLGTTKTAAT